MASALKFSKLSAPSSNKVIVGIEWDATGTYYRAWYIVTVHLLIAVIIIVSIAEMVVMNQKESFLEKSEFELSPNN